MPPNPDIASSGIGEFAQLSPFSEPGNSWGLVSTSQRWLPPLIAAVAVFAMDVSKQSEHVSLGYIAVVLLATLHPEPRAPLYASLSALALTFLAAAISPRSAETLLGFERGLVGLALVACGSASFLKLQADASLRNALGQIKIFAGVARNLDAPVTILDANGRVIFWNRGAERLYDIRGSEAIGMKASELYPADISAHALGVIAESARKKTVQTIDASRLTRQKQRISVTETIFPILGDRGQILAVTVIDRDQTALRESERVTYELAHYDRLTALPNRRLFQQRLDEALECARRHDRLTAVLFLDLDGFKGVNDALGHEVGDEFLCHVAERLMGAVRRTDYIGRHSEDRLDNVLSRLGGDEFTVILTDVDSTADAALTAQRMLDSLQRPILLGNHETSITASAGIAIYPFDGLDSDALVRNADTAMHKAKGLGPGQCVLYSDEMNSELKRRLAVATAVRRAFDEGRLELHYQPQARIRDAVFVGAEALLRINDPELGPIGPAEFIPIAEKNGLITALGEWVLETACKAAASWQRAGYPLRVAVNVSTHQLRVDDALVGTVDRVLATTGVDPALLELEITESAVMDEEGQPLQTLKALRKRGIRVVLDDFGTGYSSLGRLVHLPLDGIKIDQSFLKRIETNAQEAALVKSVIAMAKCLDLHVVAEGVETQGQLDFLRKHDCDEAQGYLLSRPIPESKIIERLQQPPWPDTPARTETDQ